MYEFDNCLALGNPEQYWGLAGAGILAMAKDTGRFLVQLRSSHVNEPGTWNIVGGALNPDELEMENGPLDAAIREFEEETGYAWALDREIEMTQLWLYYDPEHDFEYHTFLATVNWEFMPNVTWESAGWAWVSLRQLLRLKPKHFGLEELLSSKEVVMALQKATVERRLW
jgi:8-oxo-dGTP pyrophosphatase MutT (NUDIX family)